MGELVSIVSKPKDAPLSETGYTRVPQQQALLVVDRGIAGDAKGSRNRQLNVMSAQTLHTLAGEGYRTAPGEMGEQLILAGVEVDSLEVGTRLQIGAEAHIEITEPRTGCGKFERHQGRPRQETAGRLGMMAKVVAGGSISVGDSVTVIPE